MKLSVENVVFGYDRGETILNSISFQVENNDTIAIVGASGSGKSTLLRLICGIIQENNKNNYSGKITIDGFKPKEYTMQGKIGFMFQEPALFPNLPVKANVALPLKFLKKKSNGKVDTILEKVGLGRFTDYLPRQLSGGMKTRVALARTFITEPSLLLLDEPFSSLDIKWKYLLYRELENLKQDYSCTIILVTHDIQEALLLSNHILVFGNKGEIIKELKINKPLPRVFETDAMKDLQDEYVDIQRTIMNN